MFIPDLETLRNVMREKGYVFFVKGDYNLNLIGIRRSREATNTFDDTFCCIFKVDDSWVEYYWPCTTDPGKYWLENGSYKGTAVLVPDQYVGAWRIGYHKGSYRALVQKENVSVYRDTNADGVFDYDDIDVGLFGINIHRATPNGTSIRVDKWSAGCQVLASSAHFDLLMRFVEESSRRYGNAFTYTLLERKDFDGQCLTKN